MMILVADGEAAERWLDAIKNYQRPINTVMGLVASMIENSISKLTMAFSLEKIINVWLIGSLAQLIKKVYPKRSAISAYLKMEDYVIWPINKKVWRNCCSSWLAMRSKIKTKQESKANWKRKCRSWKDIIWRRTFSSSSGKQKAPG